MASETLDSNSIDLQAIEQDVKKSSLGQWLLDNTKLFVGIIVGITVAALAFVWYGQIKENNKVESYSKAYQFKTTTLDSLVNDKTSSEDAVKNYKSFISTVEAKQVLIPISLELSNQLISKDKKFDAAISVLSETLDTVGNTAGVELVKVQLASIYEDSGDTQKSIAVLEGLKRKLPSYLGAYTYFNLGRMYKNSNNKVKAKEQLDYVIKTYKDSEESKLASLILEEL